MWRRHHYQQRAPLSPPSILHAARRLPYHKIYHQHHAGISTNTSPPQPIMLGCVAYCESITKIWDGMRSCLRDRNVDIDYCTFTNYERQVDALESGFINMAWNGPLAHVRLERRVGKKRLLSLAMRDVDRDFKSVVVARSSSSIRTLLDLPHKSVATGTFDSPQAYLLPLHFLKKQHVPLHTLSVTRYDCDVGKHGDTACGEEDALDAVLTGRCDVALVSDMMVQRCKDKHELRVVHHFPTFDHCQFDCLVGSLPKSTTNAFISGLLAMQITDPKEEPVMKLEGIRSCWLPNRESGYDHMRELLQEVNDPITSIPPALYSVDNHPFSKFDVVVS